MRRLRRGGPVDRHHRDEKRALRELTNGPHRVALVAITRGLHYAGKATGCGTQSEAGISCEGARAGDEFTLAVNAVVPGTVLPLAGEERPEGVELAGHSRLGSRDDAWAKLAGLEVESCWSAAGTRLAVRATVLPPLGSSWALFDFPRAEPRWVSVLNPAACAEVVGREPATPWQEGARETREAAP
ncbi:MAG: hypothetical protein EXR72_18070 [Myxococcales bacterium]|nr:hypothetical protein [Myxococcales bacterium]